MRADQAHTLGPDSAEHGPAASGSVVTLLPPPLRASDDAGAGGHVPRPAHLRPVGSPRPLHNLPAQPTRLIGRDREVQVLGEQLLRPDVRLMTLTGPAGTGKTRLAVEAAGDLVTSGAYGALLVNLAPIGDPDLVGSKIAQTLGVREAGDRPLLESLKEAVRDQRLLLVLDNFEHVVAAAPQVADLLAECPSLKVLATSRAALRLRWEHEMPVTPLAVPDPRRLPPLEALSQVPAVALFVDRARAVKPDFALTDANARAVAEICARLDGLPLAIELAAARVKVLPLPALLGRLERRLDLLQGGAQDQPDRHRTLRAAIAWSYDLLADDERALFRRLAVFPGGCTLESAEAVCIEDDPASPVGASAAVLDALASLVDKSLVQQEAHGSEGEPRFGLLETVREFALDRLAQAGEQSQAQRRAAEHVLALVRAAEPELAGHRQAATLDRLEQEHDNLRAALRWAIDARDTGLAVWLGAAVWPFWHLRGYLREGRAWLAETLLLPGAASYPGEYARLLHGAGTLAFVQGDYAAARSFHQESLALRQRAGDRRGAALSLGGLGDVAHQQGAYDEAATLHQQALAILRDLDDQPGIAQALDKLGLTVRCQGDYPAAGALYQEALAISRALGNRAWEAQVLNNLGRVAFYEADYPAARSLHEEALAIYRALSHPRGMALSLGDLGDVAQQQHDLEAARRLREEGLGLWQQIEDRWGLAYALEGFAQLAAAVGEPDRVARLIGASTAQREAIHAPRSPASRDRLQRLLDRARRALGEAAFASAWEAGRRLALDEVVAVALATGQAPAAGQAEPTRPPSGPRDDEELAQLTPREREVARLVARGCTNKQIAEALVIGDRTADTHVAHILGKLGLTSRTQIATWVVAHGLDR